jgi:uncharacterized protein (DUF302 family)
MDSESLIMLNQSRFDLETTLRMIMEKALQTGWKVPFVHDLKESLFKAAGKIVLPVKVIELCNPAFSGPLLENDEGRRVSILMPCRIAVYEKSDGTVWIGRMNTDRMAAGFGGIIAESMAGASQGIEALLDGLFK